jgi:hypothetical protein
MATYCFVPPFHKANFVVCPHEPLLNLGVPWVKKRLRNTELINIMAETALLIMLQFISVPNIRHSCAASLCQVVYSNGECLELRTLQVKGSNKRGRWYRLWEINEFFMKARSCCTAPHPVRAGCYVVVVCCNKY